MKDKARIANDGQNEDIVYTSIDMMSLHSCQKTWSLFYFGTGCVSTAIFFTALLLLYHVVTAPKPSAEIEAEDWNYCGRSSVIAQARGCVMEPMFYGWMPPQCVYQELTKNYPVFEDRKYYRDVNMTQELKPEQLWVGEYSVIYTSRYHDEHCLFQWRKLQYAMDQRMDFVDNKTISKGHSKHCADQLSRSCEAAIEQTQPTVNHIELGFYRCRKTFW